jgi:RHH-type transcriptional regulator, proline utilization regulon repressor / proline dehydrogenase / delta 1-pyrroline-5-carboxylate dehydrogenase
VSPAARTTADPATAPPFANEPALELRRASDREALAGALARFDSQPSLEVPVLIGGERGAADGIESMDPGNPARLVARAAVAGEAEVDAAVDAASQAARDWGARPAAERASVLAGAASLLRERRLELAALEVRECAKPWAEADADVCEAIDFIEYYLRAALELEAGPELLRVPGDRNCLRYAARGVVAVISPWNFPLAIPTGMVAAGLATGNAVVLKPAEQAPACAFRLVEAMHESGVPPGALALLPGYGETGAALVRHPGVHTIAFTGSGAVGQEILRAAAEIAPGQAHVKGVVAEMGGKNCVIVDADADLDQAVPAIVRSAFAYAGQKCSACARVLVHEALAPALIERLAGAVDVLAVGQAERFGTDVPPVIERAAQERVLGYAELGASQGRVVARHERVPEEGWFCAPTVLTDLPPGSPLLREEIFGPVLTAEPVADAAAACEIVEGLPFALTGGLFSRDPETVAAVERRLPVGNLYVNRGITGAMVGRQPFGGNRLSGIGSKAGGPNYLLQFVEPRVVCEDTMRHGLVME